MDRAAIRALAYAAALGQPAFALHISPTAEEADRFLGYWQAWGDHLPLEVIVSPHRAVVAPLVNYLGLAESVGATEADLGDLYRLWPPAPSPPGPSCSGRPGCPGRCWPPPQPGWSCWARR